MCKSCFTIFTIFAISVFVNVADAEDQKPGGSTRVANSAEEESASAVAENPAIQFAGFVELAKKLQPIREARRVPIATFMEMSRDPQTVLLDTRSKAAFELVHISGAVHLNFSDFSVEKLRKLIPSKETRILIYCNNNFRAQLPADSLVVEGKLAKRTKGAKSNKGRDKIMEGFTSKKPVLALNIPTFINLYGYGYENVYELADQLELPDPRLELEGQAVKFSPER